MPTRIQSCATGLLAWTVFAAASMAGAQEVPAGAARQIDEIFATWSRPESPGAAVVVMKDGQVVYRKGYGYANLDYDIPIAPETVFDIASVSKHFTAFAIAMLADQGKLSLDDDVRKHVPELPDFGHTVTLRHLIHHTSGIRDWVELLSISGFRFDDVIAPTDIMTFALDQRGLNFVPGAEHLYSNTGYNLLALTVERVSGQPFALFMEEQIFRPLGMNDTHILMDHQRVVKNRATSYAPNENIGELRRLHREVPPADGSWRVWVDNTSAPGSSSVVTSVNDMSRWMLNWETAQVGGPNVLRQMSERAVLNDGQQISYAFGLDVETHRGLKMLSHSGGWRGFRTHFVRFPDQRLSVSVFGNSTSFDAAGTALGVAEVLLGRDLGPAEPTPPRPQRTARSTSTLPGSRLGEYEGEYRSVELATTYRVVVENGGLVLKHRKMDDQLLSHLEGDKFVSPGVRGELTFEFVRGPNDRVTGYTLRGARFRGVVFDRI